MMDEKNYCIDCGEEIDLNDTLCLECYLTSPQRRDILREIEEGLRDEIKLK